MYIFDYEHDRKTLGEYFNKMQPDGRMICKFWPWVHEDSNEKVFNGVENGWELKGFRPSDRMVFLRIQKMIILYSNIHIC